MALGKEATGKENVVALLEFHWGRRSGIHEGQTTLGVLSLQVAGQALLGIPGGSRATTCAWVSARLISIVIIIQGLLGLALGQHAWS